MAQQQEAEKSVGLGEVATGTLMTAGAAFAAGHALVKEAGNNIEKAFEQIAQTGHAELGSEELAKELELMVRQAASEPAVNLRTQHTVQQVEFETKHAALKASNLEAYNALEKALHDKQRVEGLKSAIEFLKKEPANDSSIAKRIKSAEDLSYKLEQHINLKDAGFFTKPYHAFKGLSGGGKAAVVVGALTAGAGAGLAIYNLKGDNHESPSVHGNPATEAQRGNYRELQHNLNHQVAQGASR